MKALNFGTPKMFTVYTLELEQSRNEPRCEKTGPTMSHTNLAVQPHKTTKGLKLRI